MRGLAKIADERWTLKGQQAVERLAVGSSDEALKGIILNSRIDQAIQGEQKREEKRDITDEHHTIMKRNLPGQDPGTTVNANPRFHTHYIHGDRSCLC